MRDLPVGFILSKGSHSCFEQGACIMEAVAYVAGEPHSDEPACTSRLLTRIAIRFNDRFTYEERQLLTPLIPRLVGTRTDCIELERARALVMVDAAVREIVPMALDIWWPDLAKQLRDIGPIIDSETARVASKVTQVVRDKARKRADADTSWVTADAAESTWDAVRRAAHAADDAIQAAAHAAVDAIQAAARAIQAAVWAAESAAESADVDAAAAAAARIVLASIAAFERCIGAQLQDREGSVEPPAWVKTARDTEFQHRALLNRPRSGNEPFRL